MGPGLITGASDDDPSGILTYLQAGAVLGFKTLWMVFLTLPLMYGIQEMCGRIGYVTEKGLVKLIKENYSKFTLYLVAFISVVVITINISADLLAGGVILEKFSGIDRQFWIPITSFLIVGAIVAFSYQKFSRILKWLTLSLFFYVVTVFFMNVNWLSAIKATVMPSFDFSALGIMLMTAIFGTTISPYLFFWQTSEEVEEREDERVERKLKRFLVTKNELKVLKEDTFAGMLFSNLVMWFIIVGASNLALYGVNEIVSFDQAAMVLEPLLGSFAFLAFGLGIIGTGFLAIPVLAGSVGYIISEAFNWPEGLNKKFSEAKSFYLVIGAATLCGMMINFFSIDPIALLIKTAVLYAIITPILIFVIMRIANNRHIMRDKKNSRTNNFLGVISLIVTTIAVLAYLGSVLL